MKKIVTLALVAVLALALVACGGGVKDGTYSAKASAENYGWTDTLSVTYKDGKITSAVYDSVDATGALKSETDAETYPMDPHPSEWTPAINDAIVAAGSAEAFEGVAGATTSSTNAKALLEAIEANVADGKTGEVLVDMPQG